MKWSQPAERKVVEAVVAVFGPWNDQLYAMLSSLTQVQWEQSYYWLDASGMALYLLAKVERLELEDAIPFATLARLRENLADNRRRTDAMLGEFAELNREFRAAGVAYCNLKGFTLVPHSCPDPALRCQLDLDFLVDGNRLEVCRELLERRGFHLRGATEKVWEFKTQSNRLADIADHYKPRPQRCIEIHFACGATPMRHPIRDERLDRLGVVRVGSDRVPTLNDVDQILGQATHLFGHLCAASTRPAWLLEFARHVEARDEDTVFWRQVEARLAADRDAAIAFGACCVLAAEVFKTEIPNAIRDAAVAAIPRGVALWLERYGRRALLADFPGTKLYLMLLEQLNATNTGWEQEKRKMLVPTRRAPRIVHINATAGMAARMRGEVYQLRFDLFRLRFHLIEGLRYLIEARQWRRFLAERAEVEAGEIRANRALVVQR